MANIAHTRGVFLGGMILTIFGGFWSIIALSFMQPRPAWGIPLAIVVTIGLLLSCAARLWSTRKIRSAEDPAAAAKGKRDGIWFGIICGIEGVLIGLSCALLGAHALGRWIPFTIAVIVGIHFLPLARLFRVPVYYWTAALSTLGVLACLLIRDIALQSLCVGFVMTAVLWLTVSYLLATTRVTNS